MNMIDALLTLSSAGGAWCIWWWSASSDDQGYVMYLFIIITPRSTLAWSSSTY